MSDTKFLERLFHAYYQNKRNYLPLVSCFDNREFGFIPWEKSIMIRHLSFKSDNELKDYFVKNPPKHAYVSGTIYNQPDAQKMENKQYRGCDLIVDIDVDHFYTPCKEHHDLWYCKECGAQGTGMPEKCSKCGKIKLNKLNWLCNDCLKVAKEQILSLIYNFLIPDFNLNKDDMRIAFSGHRGYHLKVENDMIRSLTSEDRREIVDYLTGENLSFEILGLKEKSGSIYGLSKANIGWSQKIINEIERVISLSNLEIENLLLDKRTFDLHPKEIRSFLNYKDDFCKEIINKNRNIWAIEGFGLTLWKKFLRGIVKIIGIELDEPVTVDIHRLIRYPGSLHGKTGFKVQELNLDELRDFAPLDEQKQHLDPIVFHGKKNVYQKLEITEIKVPPTSIKGDTFGPYEKGQIIKVPHHIAVFLLCKEVAKTV